MSIKKIIKTKILCLVFFIPVFSYSAWQGAGTETDPWQITSRRCLEALAGSVNSSPSNNPATGVNWSVGKYFKVMNDITDSVRTMIGIDMDAGKSFLSIRIDVDSFSGYCEEFNKNNTVFCIK